MASLEIASKHFFNVSFTFYFPEKPNLPCICNCSGFILKSRAGSGLCYRMWFHTENPSLSLHSLLGSAYTEGKDANSQCELRISERILRLSGSQVVLSAPLKRFMWTLSCLWPVSMSAGEDARVACCSCCLSVLHGYAVCCLFWPPALIAVALKDCFGLIWSGIKMDYWFWVCGYWRTACRLFSDQATLISDLVSAVQADWCVMFSKGKSCQTPFKKWDIKGK